MSDLTNAYTVNSTIETPIVEITIEVKYQGSELGALTPTNRGFLSIYSPGSRNPIATIMFLNVLRASDLRLSFMTRRNAATTDRERSMSKMPNFAADMAEENFESHPARISWSIM